MVDHDLTNDFNYDSKQNRSQNYLFLGKIVNINSVQRLREMGKIFVVSMHICWYIGIKILHSGSSYPTANKDICYDHDCPKLAILGLNILVMNDLALLQNLFWNSEETKLLICTVIFLSGV